MVKTTIKQQIKELEKGIEIIPRWRNILKQLKKYDRNYADDIYIKIVQVRKRKLKEYAYNDTREIPIEDMSMVYERDRRRLNDYKKKDKCKKKENH